MKKIIEAMKHYDKTLEALEKTHRERLEVLAEKYGSGTYYNETVAELEADLVKARTAAKDELKKVIEAQFEEMEGNIKEFVLAPIPEGFTETMQAINACGAKLSESEVKLLSANFGSCYFAKKGFASVTDNSTRVFLSYDEIMQEVEETRTGAFNWVEHYDPNKYSHDVMVSDESPLLSLEATVNDFMN
ncbi:MAG: hypothetical protein KBS60_00135 [Phascolarctobacterium sp.]|nr:hypothetical protein [Candidatus Phascolarctobacterium caballi]